ncbi:hypothetical protein M1843_04105 [Isoptericola sp. 4D.3]|uniref:Integral membrane protein n=1 Tax=Isoptericola peretonis TaxID=2918523 RepID=A0ABT0J0B8_9MICO|nr:hypothetical protein [Isoptericola sp. 4D.3]
MAGVRSFLSGVLVLLAVVAAVVAVPARYAEGTLLDTDAYVRTTAPMAAEITTQDAVAESLTGVVTGQIDSGLLAAAARPLVGEVAEAFVRSDSFPPVWEEANRQGHAAAVRVLRDESDVVDAADGVVTLPLDPFLERIGQVLRDRGLPVTEGFATTDDVIVLYASQDLSTAQSAVALVDRWTPWALPVVVVLAALAVVVARPGRRLATAAVTGGLVAVAMLVMVVLLPVAVQAAFAGLDVGASGQQVLDDAVDALLVPLRTQLWWAFGVAAAVGVGSAVAAGVVRARRPDRAPGGGRAAGQSSEVAQKSA